MRRFVLALVLSIVAVGAIAPIVCTHTAEPTEGGPPNTHEVLTERPSGFWTSNRPAVGGAYRYRLLLIGVAVAMGTGFLMWRIIRKANAERVRR
jgi:hypothetical protein